MNERFAKLVEEERELLRGRGDHRGMNVDSAILPTIVNVTVHPILTMIILFNVRIMMILFNVRILLLLRKDIM